MRLSLPLFVLLASLFLPTLALGQQGEPPFPTNESWRRNRALIGRFDQLDRAGKRTEAWVFLDSLVNGARARGDRALLMQALIKRGGTRTYRGEFDQGEADLVAADQLAIALRDTLGVLEATRWRALARTEGGRHEESIRLWARMRDWARSWGSPSHEGWARLGLALADLERGRVEASRQGYRRSRELFTTAGDAMGLRQAGVGLQRVLTRQGRHDEMRELTMSQVREARAAEDRLTEAQLYNNLGVLEWWLGDPRRSLELIRLSQSAYSEHERRTGRPLQPSSYDNLARALSQLGRSEEAASVLERASSEWRTRDLDSWAELETSLASVRLRQIRNGEAERRMRSVLALRDSIGRPANLRATAVLMLALSNQRRGAEALTLAIRHRGDLAGLDAGVGGELRAEIVRAFVMNGRPADALAVIDEVGKVDQWTKPARGDLVSSRLRTEALAELGRLSEAAERLPLLTKQLLALRSFSRDYTSRESFGDDAAAVSALAARVLTDPALPMTPTVRAERVFDALQPLKAITLDERLRAPGNPDSAGAFRPVTLTRLRAQVLRDGELLLDLHTGGDRTILIAVSLATLRLVDLGPSRAFVQRLDRFHELLSGTDVAVADEAAASLGRSLLGDVIDLVRSHRVLLFSPGAQPIAIAALRLPGERDPIGAWHPIAMIPSATVFARLRAQGGRAQGPIVALAGGEDARGRRLAGARSEVRWLSAHFEGVRTPPVSDAEGAMRVLKTAGVAHLAGHSEVDADNPWGARLLLGEAERPRAWLEASRVARSRLGSRLAVLSGCHSIGTARNGEGALGLASAFLSAGVPSTIASLWEVDDARTAEMMRGFYRSLAEGRPVGEAMRSALVEMRARTGGAKPSDWAAFMLVGLPETRVTLRRTLASRVLP